MISCPNAYICSNVDYIITNDHHFNILKQIEFPEVNILTIDEFLSLINDTQPWKTSSSSFFYF